MPSTFRAEVVDKFKFAFGAPEVSKVVSGELYRWTLQRGPYDISLFVTIDSPEFTDRVHVMISDGAGYQVEPISTATIYTHAEADALIERIRNQWKQSAK